MKTEATAFRRMTAPAVILTSALIAAGCSMTAQPKAGSVRSSGETAPADLQLACASEAASRFSIKGSVLPVSSMRGPGDTYQVNLTMEGGGQAICFIDNNAVVQSLEQV